MDSRIFIKEANELIDDIKVFKAAYLQPEDEQMQGNALQKRTNVLFAGLQNPTLPSAYRLRDACAEVGLFVDPRTLQRIAAYEHIQG